MHAARSGCRLCSKVLIHDVTLDSSVVLFKGQTSISEKVDNALTGTGFNTCCMLTDNRRGAYLKLHT